MQEVPIAYPGRFAPGFALNFADSNGTAKQVSATSPLPVTLAAVAASPSASLGGTTASAATLGPFTNTVGKALILSLTGSWTGTVELLRSVDSGVTRMPLTLAGSAWGKYTGNICEPVWDESETGATFYLQISPTSGSVTYRLAQ